MRATDRLPSRPRPPAIRGGVRQRRGSPRSPMTSAAQNGRKACAATPPQQRARLGRLEQARERGRRERRGHAEAHELQRVRWTRAAWAAGCPARCRRSSRLIGPKSDRPPAAVAAQRRGRLLDGSIRPPPRRHRRAGASTGPPASARRSPCAARSKRRAERRVDRKRVRGRAFVVHQARQRELAAARAAAEALVGLEHAHVDSFGRERQSGSQPVRARCRPPRPRSCGCGHSPLRRRRRAPRPRRGMPSPYVSRLAPRHVDGGSARSAATAARATASVTFQLAALDDADGRVHDPVLLLVAEDRLATRPTPR